MLTEILNYTIIRKIGEGGMGRVFLAKNKSIAQFVAIKMLHPRYASNPALRERFRQEAIMLSSLNHPNIVKFLNFVENEYGVFLIMEYVEGMTLDDYLNKKTGLLVEAKAFPMMDQILNAFAYAHERNLVHRDIKPGNILVDNDGNIKVLDFGIAQILNDAALQNDKYTGTPEYMSPEQIQGKPLDVRSDIYSLGVVFHQMLTGRPPYDTSTMSAFDIKQAVVSQPLRRMKTIYPYISDATQDFVDHALCKNPADRFPDCNSMIKELDNLRSAGNKPPKPDKKKSSATLWIILGIAVAILTGAGIVSYIYLFGQSEKVYADYVEKFGVSEGIGDGNNVAGADHYKIIYSGTKPVRVTYVNSKGETTGISDSLLARYKEIDTEYMYDPDGKHIYKNIYDQNGNFVRKVTYDTEKKEATVEIPFDTSGDTYRFTYNLVSGLPTDLYYINKDKGARAINGVYGERYNYDPAGRLVRVTYLDKYYKPAEDDSGVGYIGFEYKDNLSQVESKLYDKNGKPIEANAASKPKNKEEAKTRHRDKARSKSRDDKKDSRQTEPDKEHTYLKSVMNKDK